MKIQIGKICLDEVENQQIFSNKTRRYLLPCLKEYGKDFMGKLDNVFKVAAGIGDIVVDANGVNKYERHVFILLDSNIAHNYFLDFIEWIREQPMYEDDYVFGNIQKSSMHMVIIKLPEKYYDSFVTFKKGKYSQMFNKETIETFFTAYPNVVKVFIKDKNYKIIFTNRVNRKFGLTDNHAIKPEDWEPDEYDFPPSEQTEVFNHHLKK